MDRTRSTCESCVVRGKSLCSAIGDTAACDFQRIVHRVRVQEGRIITGGQAAAKTFSIIISGVVKLVTNRPDGQRQIVGLQFPGDFVGRPFGGSPNWSAESATDLELCSFSGNAFEELLGRHPDLERAVLKRVLDDLDASRDWLFLLGRKTAEEKVATFLAMIADRTGPAVAPGDTAQSAPVIRSPLSRSEIAECLSLRLETVSRQFALLKARGIIETTGRRTFIVRDMVALRRFSDSADAAA